MAESPQPDQQRSTSPSTAHRPEVIAAEDGPWAEKPPPDLQPQFRCVVHPRGSIVPSQRSEATAGSFPD